MMYLPSIFAEGLMDDWFDDFDKDFRNDFHSKKNPLYGKNANHVMKTDVREHDDSYEVDIDLPGFDKDSIKVSLENGYLNIMASKGLNKDEVDKKSGKLIRNERYSGTVSRSFYVGNSLRNEDIKAKYDNGVLSLDFPKVNKKEVDENKYIAIEG